MVGKKSFFKPQNRKTAKCKTAEPQKYRGHDKGNAGLSS
jgi:hypothetical protein